MKTVAIILSILLNLPYTKGKYNFTCKTTATKMQVVASIMERVKSIEQKLTDAQYKTLVRCLWVVNHLSNKLEGICSISSSVHDNCFCKAYRKAKKCICSHCYAHNQQLYQTGLKEHNVINGIILRNILIPTKFFKALIIVFPYLRIESFGDVANVTQCRNYLRIIKAQSDKRCAIWSKNITLWAEALKLEGKPNNTTYVHSSRYLNKPDNVSNYDFVDHVFTVYDKKYAKENNVVINCGGKKCMECIAKHKNCYYRVNKNNDTYYINELLK